MFISLIRYGRLTNRLFYLARLIALSKECNQVLLDFSLLEYSYALADPSASTPPAFIVASPLFNRLYIFFYLPVIKACHFYFILQDYIPFLKNFCEVVSFLSPTTKNLDALAASGYLSKSNKLYFFCDWFIVAPKILQKHKSYCISCLRPASSLIMSSSDLVISLLSGTDLLIGIVIRREDYKNHASGRYFYSMHVYRSIADRCLQLFSGKSLRFFFCSVDQECMKVMNGLDFFYRPGCPLGNLYVLSSCHFLVSPPSTYAMWASFVGDVPLCIIPNPSFEFDLSDFCVQSY